MKKNKITICLFIVFLISFRITAQPPCNPKDVANTKGAWKKSTGYNTDRIPAGNTNLIKRTNNIVSLFRSAIPEPKGMEAGWYSSESDNPLFKNGPIPFEVNCFYLNYYCDKWDGNKLKLYDETAVVSNVFANSFKWFLYWNGMWTVDGKRISFFMKPRQKGEWKGYPLYIGNDNASSTVLLTHDNQLPYTPVTQKQYLLAVLDSAEKKYQHRISEIDKDEETLKKLLAGDEKNPYIKNKEEYVRNSRKQLSDYQKNKDSYKKEAEINLQKQKKPIEEYLNNTSEEKLQSPAIVWGPNGTNATGMFSGKFDTEEGGGRMVVRINYNYFKKELPAYIPQLFILYWGWSADADDIPSKNFKQQFESDFNVEKLKAMIDK